MYAETILVVDSQDDIRDLIVGVLQGAGYDVMEAQSSEAALAVLARREADLLICNVRMPDVGGIDLSLRAHAVRPGLRVLLTTVRSRPDEAQLDKTYWLEQPRQPDLLLSEVERILHGSSER